MNKECRVCKKEFYCKPCRINRSKYCSIICKHIGRIGEKMPDSFSKKISLANKGCIPWNKGKKCPQLGWSLGTSLSTEHKSKISKSLVGRTCSKETRVKISLAQKGKSRIYTFKENHWNWKGGISSQDKLERNKFRREIQKQVFERDNYLCQMCGKGGHLQVDHIQKWSEYVELRFSMDNCRTLCDRCHYKVTYGREMPENVKAWGQNFKHLERERV